MVVTEPWKTDKTLSWKDLVSINAEKSLYGKTRAYNIIRNSCVLDNMKVAALAKEVISNGKKTHKRREKEKQSVKKTSKGRSNEVEDITQ